MRPQDKRTEIAEPKPKAPYQQPEFKRVGTLRDLTAALLLTGSDESSL